MAMLGAGAKDDHRMSTDPTTETSPTTSVGGRRATAWLGLMLATLLVMAAVVVARPWDDGGDSGFGPVAQIAPAAADAAGLPTAPAVGKLAPNFRLQTLDGKEVRLSDLRGRPVFLNFWATWCFFCLTEMPAMQRVADEYGERVTILGVNVGESAGTARAFADREGIHFPLALDADKEVVKAYQARAMPTSLFIDADGVVRSLSYGPLTPPQMKEHLAGVLAP